MQNPCIEWGRGGGAVQRYMPGKLPPNGDWNGGAAQTGRISPLQAVVALGECVRSERGRVGVKALLDALSAHLDGELLCRAAEQLEVDPPSVKPQKEHVAKGMDMEKMLSLMQLMQNGKGGGLDPKLLMQLMQQRQ